MNDNILSAYAAELANVSGLAEKVAELVNGLPDRVEMEKIHWGHVGDLKNIASKLAEVLEFMNDGK